MTQEEVCKKIIKQGGCDDISCTIDNCPIRDKEGRCLNRPNIGIVELAQEWLDEHTNDNDFSNQKKILKAIKNEVNDAIKKYSKFNSLHEGYAVLLEEVDELWDEIKKKPDKQDIDNIKKEAIQVAAMAVRIILDCIENKE